MNFFRTDMAVESAQAVGRSVRGLQVEERTEGEGIKVTVVDVTDAYGEKMVNKPMGRYVTIDVPDMALGDIPTNKEAARIFAQELEKLLQVGGEDAPYLVVGVGNRSVTADSVGPLAAEGIIVTRHMFGELREFLPPKARSACAIAPGVLGETGLETGEVIKSLVEEIKPRAVIAIDSLASQKPQRIAASIQVANTGISPGSGLGNNRPRLDKAYLGVPVIAVGVPMVVYASSIAYEASSSALEDADVPERVKERLVEMLNTSCGDLVVTPKDVDAIADNCAAILSSGINMAIHDLSYDEAAEYQLSLS